MRIFIGPQQRRAERIEIEAKLKGVKVALIIVTMALPLALFGIMKWVFVENVPKGDYSAVAMIQTVNGGCSGFLVGKKHLITAAHCLDMMQEGDYVNLTFEGNPQEYTATILHIPNEYRETTGNEQLRKDYAVLELDTATFDNYFPLQLNQNSTDLTDPIIVAGYPGGATFSVASGTVTGLRWRSFDETLQIMAGAWPGNSGGPVIDAETNKVIGILNGGDPEMLGMLISLKIDVLANDINLSKKVELNYE